MNVLLSSFGILVPWTIIVLPFGLFAWRLLATRRTRTRPTWVAAMTAALDVTIVLTGTLVLALVLTPVGNSDGSSLHLMPGSDIVTELDDDGSLWQIAGNLILLAPLGALAPPRIRALSSLGRVTLAALTASTAIEITQYLIQAGRITSTDDVLLNTVGAIAGATLTCGWPRRPAAPLAIPAQTRRTINGAQQPIRSGRS